MTIFFIEGESQFDLFVGRSFLTRCIDTCLDYTSCKLRTVTRSETVRWVHSSLRKQHSLPSRPIKTIRCVQINCWRKFILSSTFRSPSWKSTIIHSPKVSERSIMGKSKRCRLRQWITNNASSLGGIIPSPWNVSIPRCRRINLLNTMNTLTRVHTEVTRRCSLLTLIPLHSTRTHTERSLIPPRQPIWIIAWKITNNRTVMCWSVHLDSIRWLCLRRIRINFLRIHSTVAIPVTHQRWCTIQRTATWVRQHTNLCQRSIPTVDIPRLSITTILRLSELVFCFVLLCLVYIYLIEDKFNKLNWKSFVWSKSNVSSHVEHMRWK